MTPNERRYCELARDYAANDDPQSAHAIDGEMRDLEATDPAVAALAMLHPDDELAALLDGEPGEPDEPDTEAMISEATAQFEDRVRAFVAVHGRVPNWQLVRQKTLEEIPPADREYSSAYYDRYGEKVTANGIAWEERMLDGDYLYALTHASEPSDPADRDDFDDRDWSDD